MKLPPYNPDHVNMIGLGFSRFARRYLGNRKCLLPDHNGFSLAREIRPERKHHILLSFPPGTEMFHFPGCAPHPLGMGLSRCERGFPIRKSSVITIAWHLTEAYRSHATSFFASQEPRHPPYALHSCKECYTPFRVPHSLPEY